MPRLMQKSTKIMVRKFLRGGATVVPESKVEQKSVKKISLVFFGRFEDTKECFKIN